MITLRRAYLGHKKEQKSHSHLEHQHRSSQQEPQLSHNLRPLLTRPIETLTWTPRPTFRYKDTAQD